MNTIKNIITYRQILIVLSVLFFVSTACVEQQNDAEAQTEETNMADSPEATTIEIYDDRAEVFTPSPDLEFNNGDIYLEHTVIRDRETDERVGRLVTRMQVVEAYAPASEEAPMGDNEFILDCTAEFEDGTITFYGPGKMGELMANGVSFSVMGGTGRYAGVRGTVLIGPVTDLRGEPIFPGKFHLK